MKNPGTVNHTTPAPRTAAYRSGRIARSVTSVAIARTRPAPAIIATFPNTRSELVEGRARGSTGSRRAETDSGLFVTLSSAVVRRHEANACPEHATVARFRRLEKRHEAALARDADAVEVVGRKRQRTIGESGARPHGHGLLLARRQRYIQPFGARLNPNLVRFRAVLDLDRQLLQAYRPPRSQFIVNGRRPQDDVRARTPPHPEPLALD